MKRFLIIFLLFLMPFSGSSLAEEVREPFQAHLVKTETIPVNLRTIVGLVEAQYLGLKIANAQAKQAEGQFYQSLGQMLPSLRAQYYVEKLNGGQIFIQQEPIEVRRTTLYPRAFLTYELSGGTVFNALSSRNKLDRIKLNYDQSFQTALLNVASDYLRYLRDVARMHLTQESLNEASQLVQLNQDRKETGFGTQFEVLQSQTTEIERKNDLLAAHNAKENSEVSLLTSLNLPLSTHLMPEEDHVPNFLFVDEAKTLTDYLELAETHRPDLKQLTLQIKEVRNQYRAAYANLLPTLFVTSYVGKVGQQGTDLREVRQGGVAVTADLLKNMGMPSYGNIKAQKGMLEETIYKKEQQANEIKKSLAKAFYDYQFFQDRLRMADEKVKVAHETHRIAIARQDSGVGINLEVIQAQTTLAQARLEYEQTAAEYDVSQLKLLYEAGLLTQSVFQTAYERPLAEEKKTTTISNAATVKPQPTIAPPEKDQI